VTLVEKIMAVNSTINGIVWGIPMLILYGGADVVVPPEKNCMRFADSFEKAGGNLMIERRAKWGHHPHGVEPNEVQRLVNFFDRGYGK